MIKKIMTWYLMLNKRLLKKTGFLLILLIIPILACLLNYYIETEESGLLHVALAAEDANDEFAIKLMEEIDQESEIFIFTKCSSEEEAQAMVKSSEADAAWIFNADMENNLREINEGKKTELIRVYEIEENIFLKISRERIIGVIFPYLSYNLYEQYVYENMPEGSDIEISQDELRDNYQIYAVDESMIDFEFLDSDQATIEESKFLAAPIRGLLIVLMLLSGIASTMYFLQDEKRGTFSWLPLEKVYFVLFGNNLAALSLSGVCVSLALVLSDSYTSFVKESAAMLLLIIMTAAFCSLLGTIFKTINSMAILLPTLMVCSIVFCPIFYNGHFWGQEILPPYFYLYSINDMSYLIQMSIYCLIMIPMGYLLFSLLRKKKLYLIRR